jgi:hypothetical protein
MDRNAEERQISDDRASGEYFRGRLIRFGYLSEEERKRLIATYPDLQDRFEPKPDDESFQPLYRALYIYIALIFGIVLGSGSFAYVGHWAPISHPVWTYVFIVTVTYWPVALLILRDMDKRHKERTERYWEWRGYRCDKYGRKIG